MRQKILKSMLLISLATVALTSILICAVLYNQQLYSLKQDVRGRASYIALLLNKDSLQSLALLEDKNIISRVTIVGNNGIVLFDNRIDVSTMENHLNRSEIQSALRSGTGEAVRQSNTLGQQTYYYAIRLDNGAVLRFAFNTDTAFSMLLKLLPVIILIAALVLLIAVVAASSQAKNLVAPINNINLEKPLENDVYDELSPLLIRIHHLRRHIDKQVIEAREQQQKFSAITAHMAEGLVVLDQKGIILTVNPSAMAYLGAKGTNYTGQHILTMSRSQDLYKAIDKAYTGTPAETIIVSGNKSLRVWARPVQIDNAVRGVFLFFLDVTESLKIENFRREFTANVSHELKTPLTVISGFAELMKNNLVGVNDIPAFSEKIYHEAKRMIKLVEDIIRLSMLDEKEIQMSFEKTELLEATDSVLQSLHAMAEKKGILLTISGDPVYVRAVPSLLDELIFNLCDNAIHYNRENGKVVVSIYEKGGKAVLQVQDTGIGIPNEYQSRVFERFYRVDKSHSRKTGGTGLGLSIVKHVALYHQAEISLVSDVGKGTTITVYFPPYTN